jgi:flavodoxin
MNILIVYDSLFGNTEIIARQIAQGFKNQQVRLVHAKEATAKDVEALDLLVAGSPTHAGKPSAGINDFFSRLPSGALKNIKAAAFDTGIPAAGQKTFLRVVIKLMGYAAKHIAASLRKSGAVVLAAETFFVLDKEGPLKQGETERSMQWAARLLEKIDPAAL